MRRSWFLLNTAGEPAGGGGGGGGGGAPAGGSPPASATPAAGGETPPAEEPPPAATPAPGGNRGTFMPAGAIAKMKGEERRRGREQARRDMEAAAKEAGYASWEEMQAAIKKRELRKPKPAPKDARVTARATPPATTTGATPPSTPAVSDREQRRLQRMEEEKRKANSRAGREERRRKELERALDKERADNQLRIAAVRHGVTDPEFALHLIERECSTGVIDVTKPFDEDSWFNSLREKRPHLFNVETVPANTTPKTETPAPKKGEQPPTEGKPGKIDARTMTNDQYQAELRRRGLTLPGNGSPG